VALISLYGLGLVSPAALVAIPTTLFLVVYLGCMASAARVLRGPARLAAAPAAVIVAVVLAFCGWALLAALALILAVCCAGPVMRAADRIHKRYESR
jgi:amino acid efflux transporter